MYNDALKTKIQKRPQVSIALERNENGLVGVLIP